MDSPTAALAPGSALNRFAGGASLEFIAAGTRLGNRYEIVAILGSGGMGVVYRARDLKLDRDVALKVIRPDLLSHPGVLERFHREILLSSKVTHRHILRIHDLVESDGLSFISMQYVDGVTLSERLQREGPMSADQAVPLAIQLCEALQAAHEAGVVHRDLKPQNILIDRDGRPFIADFGISRSIESGHTLTEQGAVIGTMDYMSPEQARGETGDHRGDIYSLGMVLYQMLTGALPYSGLSSITSVLKRVQEEVPDLRRARADIPLWLARVVSRALRRDPDERYPSAEELRRDLVRQHAPKVWTRVRKPRFLIKVAALLAGLALVVAGIVSGTSYVLERRRSAPIAPLTSLALLPFVNGTGDPKYDWVRAGLPDLLRTDLLQSRELRLPGAERVSGVLDGLKLGAELRPESVSLVAGLLNVENVLSGRLLKAGQQFRLEATLQHVAGSSLAGATPLRVEGASEDELFSMVDELTRRTREGLGLSRRWGEKDRGVTDLSTSSVEALRLYTEGQSLTRSGNDLEAAKILERTLEADPEFAVARASLAETYSRLGQADKATKEAARAVQALGPGTSRYENARIRGIRARLDNDPDSAVKAYRELVELVPNDAEAQVQLASVLEEKGDLAEALAILKRLTALDTRDARAHEAAGRIHLKLGNADDALRELNAALQIHVEARNEQGRAGVLNAIGNTYYRRSEYDEAQRSYEEALAIRRRIGDERGVRVCLNNIAIIHRDQGRYVEAVTTAEEALALSQSMRDTTGQAEVHATLGDIHDAAGRPEAARESYQASLRLAQEVNNEAVQSQDLASLGYINSVLGNYTEAMFFLREALEKRRTIGSKSQILRSLIDVGSVEQIQGRYEDALKHYGEGLAIAQEIREKTAVTILKANVADIRKDQGDYGAALELLDEAELLAREIGDNSRLAVCLTYRGSVLGRAGSEAGAREALEKAGHLAEETGDRALTAEIFAYRGELLATRGSSGEAASVLKQAVTVAREVQDSRLALLARSTAARAARSQREMESVLRELEKAGLAPLEVQTRVALAQLLLGAGQAARAQREAERTIEVAKALSARDVLFQAHHVAGKALERQSRIDEAAEHYASTLASLEEMRRGLPGAVTAHLLSRPETVAFAGDARELFQKANRPEEAERLRAALAPESP